MSAQVMDIFDQIGSAYDLAYQGKQFRCEDAVTYGYIRSHLRPGYILDLGCGTGAFLDYIPVPPARYIGVDLSGQMLEGAVSKHPSHRFVRMDMREFWVGPVCNVISLYESISYIPNEEAIEVVRRSTHKAGSAFIHLLAPGRGTTTATAQLEAASGTVPHVVTPQDLDAWRRAFPGLKTFYFNRAHVLKNWMPDWLYTASLKAEMRFNGPIWHNQATWILLHINP